MIDLQALVAAISHTQMLCSTRRPDRYIRHTSVAQFRLVHEQDYKLYFVSCTFRVYHYLRTCMYTRMHVLRRFFGCGVRAWARQIQTTGKLDALLSAIVKSFDLFL